MLTHFDEDGRRRPPTRDRLPWWVWAAVMLLVLLGSAMVGAR